jgi:hypothetical protein
MAGKGDQGGIEEGKKAVLLAQRPKNYILEYEMITNLAEIYTKLHMCDLATTQIDLLLHDPSYFSAEMLRIDPVWELGCPGIKNYSPKSEKFQTSN